MLVLVQLQSPQPEFENKLNERRTHVVILNRSYNMSHSFRYTPIAGHGAGSEKKDKRVANRCLRRLNKVKLEKDFGTEIFATIRDVSKEIK